MLEPVGFNLGLAVRRLDFITIVEGKGSFVLFGYLVALLFYAYLSVKLLLLKCVEPWLQYFGRNRFSTDLNL